MWVTLSTELCRQNRPKDSSGTNLCLKAQICAQAQMRHKFLCPGTNLGTNFQAVIAQWMKIYAVCITQKSLCHGHAVSSWEAAAGGGRAAEGDNQPSTIVDGQRKSGCGGGCSGVLWGGSSGSVVLLHLTTSWWGEVFMWALDLGSNNYIRTLRSRHKFVPGLCLGTNLCPGTKICASRHNRAQNLARQVLNVTSHENPKLVAHGFLKVKNPFIQDPPGGPIVSLRNGLKDRYLIPSIAKKKAISCDYWAASTKSRWHWKVM